MDLIGENYRESDSEDEAIQKDGRSREFRTILCSLTLFHLSQGKFLRKSVNEICPPITSKKKKEENRP